MSKPKAVISLFDLTGEAVNRTKNIRSATPRGFARAVFLANS